METAAVTSANLVVETAMSTTKLTVHYSMFTATLAII